MDSNLTKSRRGLCKTVFLPNFVVITAWESLRSLREIEILTLVNTIEMSDLVQIRQELDLWSGTLHSEFEIEGQPVSVRTRVHSERDLLSVQLDTSSLNSDQIAVSIVFPYARGIHAGDPSDWTNPDLHSTQEIDSDSQSVTWHRILDEDEYYVRFVSDNTLNIASPEKHHYKISVSDLSRSLSFSIEFSDQQLSDDRPDPDQTNNAVTDHGENFWTSGGAIDLSESLIPELMNWSAGLYCRSTCWFFEEISP